MPHTHTSHAAPRGRGLRTFGIAALLLALGAIGRVARADSTEACLAAYEKSQQLRQDGKLAASREQLVQCVQSTCPSLVKKDCSQWLAELDASTPTVIVNARDAQGKDVAKVRVLVDGVVLMDQLDGKPHQIDPGVHVFRYEREGAEAIEESIVIQEREKNRVITAKLAPPAQASSGPAMRSMEVSPRSPVLGYTLLGVGVAGAAAFGVLAAIGKHDVDQMRDGPDHCAPDCPSSRVDAAKTKIIVANVSLGVGLIAAGVGTFILLRPSKGGTGLQLGVRSVAGGGMTDVGYRF
jgi:hypothetical protein